MWKKCPKVQFGRSYWSCMPSFLFLFCFVLFYKKLPHCFSERVGHFEFWSAFWVTQFLLILTIHLLLSIIFNFRYYHRYVMIFWCGLNLYFTNSEWYWTLIIFICHFLFGEMSMSFAYFKILLLIVEISALCV
jgi:hypothetical protein